MISNKLSFLSLAGAILVALSSCSSHKEPYLAVQTCIEDDRAFIATFPSRIAGTAVKYGLTVVDHSSETERQLEDIKASGNVKGAVSQTINLGLFQGDQIKVMVGNLGLSRHEVLISFFGNPHDKTDRDLSRDVVGALKQHWPVQTLPSGKGALPMERCKNGPQNATESPGPSRAR